MAKSNLTPLHRQIAHVSRRLFMQTLLACLLWCWAGSLLMIAGWFLLQPHVFASLAPAWRLGVAGGIFGAGTLLALVLGVLRAPSRVAAALLLDERFALKERVTTSLHWRLIFRAPQPRPPYWKTSINGSKNWTSVRGSPCASPG